MKAKGSICAPSRNDVRQNCATAQIMLLLHARHVGLEAADILGCQEFKLAQGPQCLAHLWSKSWLVQTRAQ